MRSGEAPTVNPNAQRAQPNLDAQIADFEAFLESRINTPATSSSRPVRPTRHTEIEDSQSSKVAEALKKAERAREGINKASTLRDDGPVPDVLVQPEPEIVDRPVEPEPNGSHEERADLVNNAYQEFSRIESLGKGYADHKGAPRCNLADYLADFDNPVNLEHNQRSIANVLFDNRVFPEDYLFDRIRETFSAEDTQAIMDFLYEKIDTLIATNSLPRTEVMGEYKEFAEDKAWLGGWKEYFQKMGITTELLSLDQTDKQLLEQLREDRGRRAIDAQKDVSYTQKRVDAFEAQHHVAGCSLRELLQEDNQGMLGRLSKKDRENSLNNAVRGERIGLAQIILDARVQPNDPVVREISNMFPDDYKAIQDIIGSILAEYNQPDGLPFVDNEANGKRLVLAEDRVWLAGWIDYFKQKGIDVNTIPTSTTKTTKDSRLAKVAQVAKNAMSSKVAQGAKDQFIQTGRGLVYVGRHYEMWPGIIYKGAKSTATNALHPAEQIWNLARHRDRLSPAELLWYAGALEGVAETYLIYNTLPPGISRAVRTAISVAINQGPMAIYYLAEVREKAAIHKNYSEPAVRAERIKQMEERHSQGKEKLKKFCQGRAAVNTWSMFTMSGLVEWAAEHALHAAGVSPDRILQGIKGAKNLLYGVDHQAVEVERARQLVDSQEFDKAVQDLYQNKEFTDKLTEFGNDSWNKANDNFDLKGLSADDINRIVVSATEKVGARTDKWILDKIREGATAALQNDQNHSLSITEAAEQGRQYAMQSIQALQSDPAEYKKWVQADHDLMNQAIADERAAQAAASAKPSAVVTDTVPAKPAIDASAPKPASVITDTTPAKPTPAGVPKPSGAITETAKPEATPVTNSATAPKPAASSVPNKPSVPTPGSSPAAPLPVEISPGDSGDPTKNVLKIVAAQKGLTEKALVDHAGSMVGAHLDQTDVIAKEALEAMKVDPATLSKEAYDKVKQAVLYEMQSQATETVASATGDNLGTIAKNSQILFDQTMDPSHQRFVGVAHDRFLGEAKKAMAEYLQAQQQLENTVYKALQVNPVSDSDVTTITEIKPNMGVAVDIHSGDTAGGLMVKHGHYDFSSWGPDKARILGAHVLVNHDMLDDYWGKMATAYHWSAETRFPVDILGLNQLIDQAERGDATALQRLKEALRFIPTNTDDELLKKVTRRFIILNSASIKDVLATLPRKP